ncbi:MAG: hypothetical protein JW849_02455 [Phycisphaerae bacterium]|nr:hypothetical protein [Phycisphaerae bacterium]
MKLEQLEPRLLLNGIMPTVESITGLPGNGSTASVVVDDFTVTFNDQGQDLNSTVINNTSSWELIEAGADGDFSTSADNQVFSLTVNPTYSTGRDVQIDIDSGPLATGYYRFTAKSAICDVDDEYLDTDGDGTGGETGEDDYVHTFTIKDVWVGSGNRNEYTFSSDSILKGFASSDNITIVPEQYGGDPGPGEFEVTDGSYFVHNYSPDGSQTPLGDLRSGIAVWDSRTGTGFLMYSEESVHDRFAGNYSPWYTNADHLIAVVKTGSNTWAYDNNTSSLVDFLPRETDVLLASLDFDANTATLLSNTNSIETGSGALIITDTVSGRDGVVALDNPQWMCFADGSVYNVVMGTEGNDDLSGTSGDDLIFGLGGNDCIFAAEGNDVVYGGYGVDYIDGGLGNDEIYGEEDDDFIEGGAGDDVIDGGLGDDEMEGEEGDDTIYGNYGDDFLEGEEGVDTLYGGEGNDTIEGGSQDDEIHGGAGHDEIYGNTGIDTIQGGEGNDYIEGGADSDTIYGGIGRDRLLGGDGIDFIYGDEEGDWLFGGAGDDYLYGYAGDDYISGEDGNDDIYGGSENDYMIGGTGDDLLIGEGGDDILEGKEDSDVLIGDSTGTTGNDELYGGGGSDILIGFGGDDLLVIRPQDGDTIEIYGGDDHDLLIIEDYYDYTSIVTGIP